MPLNHFGINNNSPKSSSNFVDFVHQKTPFWDPNGAFWSRFLISSFTAFESPKI